MQLVNSRPQVRRFRTLWVLALVGSVAVSIRAEDVAEEAKVGAAEFKSAGSAGSAGSADSVAAGEEIFLREWVASDPRSHGGDGLGPLFNDTSCVSCHNQGGAGGGGSGGKNVQLITAFRTNKQNTHNDDFNIVRSLAGAIFGGKVASKIKSTKESKDEKKQTKEEVIQAERERLAKKHPGFRNARSAVLHRFSTEPEYTSWRSKFTGFAQFGMGFGFGGGTQDGVSLTSKQSAEMSILQTEVQIGNSAFFGPQSNDEFTFLKSERNATALFGTGLIDNLSDETLIQAAARKHKGFPEVTGRVARLKDGRIGRFGWKAQEASLHDFVLTACSVELGLHVPGRTQKGSPNRPDYTPPGLDLNSSQCEQLTSYVGSLPAPVATRPATEAHEELISSGASHFAKVGCATCHTENLGEATGLYSDLLLHNMGPQLGDSGSYGGVAPDKSDDEELQERIPLLTQNHNFVPFGSSGKVEEHKDVIGATRQEWRTPPLWGVRDSAPYLHDGRARTIEHAIALHGGESSRSARLYFSLKPEERQAVLTFLRSLTAPTQRVALRK
ncbi:MAG: di-heme oxidoredictase family protein [Planctomycetota bacterium]